MICSLGKDLNKKIQKKILKDKHVKDMALFPAQAPITMFDGMLVEKMRENNNIFVGKEIKRGCVP